MGAHEGIFFFLNFPLQCDITKARPVHRIANGGTWRLLASMSTSEGNRVIKGKTLGGGGFCSNYKDRVDCF